MKVNGETISLSALAEKKLPGLLSHLNLSPAHVAVELNGRLLPKVQYGSVELKEDDRIEIVHFVGGG